MLWPSKIYKGRPKDGWLAKTMILINFNNTPYYFTTHHAENIRRMDARFTLPSKQGYQGFWPLSKATMQVSVEFGEHYNIKIIII